MIKHPWILLALVLIPIGMCHAQAVFGPTPQGSAPPGYYPPVFMAGWDGTNVYGIKTDSSGDIVVSLTGSLAAVNLTKVGGSAIAIGQAAMAASLPVVISSNQSAVPISAASLPALPDNQSVNISQINAVTPLMGNGVTGTGSQRVTIASDNTPFTINAAQSGTWTVQPGNTANTTAWKVDGSAVTQPVSIASLPALPANQSINEAQINGVTPTMGNGVSGTGVQRVTIASDSTGTVAATQSGTWTVQIGNTPNSTPILQTPSPSTTGGNSIGKVLSASGTNATSTKGSAGQVYQYQFSNTVATWRYVHFYNKASSPTVGTDVPVFTVGVPPGGAVGAGDIMGIVFATGIAYSITTGSADTDTGAAGVGDVTGQFTYK